MYRWDVIDRLECQRLAAMASFIRDGLSKLVTRPPVVDLNGLIPCHLQLHWGEDLSSCGFSFNV